MRTNHYLIVKLFLFLKQELLLLNLKKNELFEKVNKIIAQQGDMLEDCFDELEKKFAIEDKIIKQINDYSDKYFSFDENGDPAY